MKRAASKGKSGTSKGKKTGEQRAKGTALKVIRLHPSDKPGPFTVMIPGWRPRLVNEWMYKHWRKVSEMKKQDALTIALSCLYAGLPLAKRKRRITLTLYYPKGNKGPDSDAPWKFLLDGLEGCGAIVNDTREFVTYDHEPTIEVGKKGTKLVIEDL